MVKRDGLCDGGVRDESRVSLDPVEVDFGPCGGRFWMVGGVGSVLRVLEGLRSVMKGPQRVVFKVVQLNRMFVFKRHEDGGWFGRDGGSKRLFLAENGRF